MSLKPPLRALQSGDLAAMVITTEKREDELASRPPSGRQSGGRLTIVGGLAQQLVDTGGAADGVDCVLEDGHAVA